MSGPEIIVRCQCGNRARVNGRCRDCHSKWAKANPSALSEHKSLPGGLS
jgi:hypothetical protein